MAEKELRKMNRTELIEIIYALQQNEKSLRRENEDLHEQLEDKTIRLEKSGSIAEAALGLNHIFEDAEKAARQYLASVKEANGPAELQAQTILANATKKAEALTKQAEKECAAKLQAADRECEEKLTAAETEAEAIVEEAKEAAKDRIAKVNRRIKLLMNKYPMLREYLEKESETGGELT